MASGPVAPVAKMGFVLASRPDAETRTVQDIVAKAKTSSLSYGHWAPGSMAQMGMELLKTKAHINKMLEVPFGGAVPVMTAVMGGQVDYAFIPTPLAVANKTKLWLYALGSPERFPSIKEVPTLTESGYAIDADTWFGVLAPPNTPQVVVDVIQAQVTRATSQPEFRARLADMGYTPITIDPKKFGEFFQAEDQRWGAAVKAARIRIEKWRVCAERQLAYAMLCRRLAPRRIAAAYAGLSHTCGRYPCAKAMAWHARAPYGLLFQPIRCRSCVASCHRTNDFPCKSSVTGWVSVSGRRMRSSSSFDSRPLRKTIS